MPTSSSNSRIRIEFAGVSKAYRLGETQRSFREALVESGRRLFTRRGRVRPSVLWALRDANFAVSAGEALGIVGPNGAGKTTVLKLLSKITLPTSGYIAVRGALTSLIELGAGFHPDLTGRENIYLNGTILGMSRKEIQRSFDEIVAFSGLEEFLDTPVKRYSSGMYARLGFSVAAHTKADILLVDEVLAVGDVGFQAKSVQRMRDLVRNGVAVVFISHSLYYVTYFCHRALLLDRGTVCKSGAPLDVVAAYQDVMRLRSDSEGNFGRDGVEECSNPRARIVGAQILDVYNRPRDCFEMGETLVLRIQGHCSERIKSPVIRCSIFSSEGVRCFGTHNLADGHLFPDVMGDFEVRIIFPELRLMPDAYSVSISLLESGAIGAYDWKEFWKGFRVNDSRKRHGVEGGLIYLPHRWSIVTSEALEGNAQEAFAAEMERLAN